MIPYGNEHRGEPAIVPPSDEAVRAQFRDLSAATDWRGLYKEAAAAERTDRQLLRMVDDPIEEVQIALRIAGDRLQAHGAYVLGQRAAQTASEQQRLRAVYDAAMRPPEADA